jgi:hypothetical protein
MWMPTPSSLAPWAKAGVSAYLEVVLAGGSEELAIPQSAVVRDGTRAIIFRRDPKNADKARYFNIRAMVNPDERNETLMLQCTEVLF